MYSGLTVVQTGLETSVLVLLHVHHSVEVPPKPEHGSPQRFHWSLRQLRKRPTTLYLHLRPGMGN